MGGRLTVSLIYSKIGSRVLLTPASNVSPTLTARPVYVTAHGAEHQRAANRHAEHICKSSCSHLHAYCHAGMATPAAPQTRDMVSDGGEHRGARGAAAQREQFTALSRHGCEHTHRADRSCVRLELEKLLAALQSLQARHDHKEQQHGDMAWMEPTITPPRVHSQVPFINAFEFEDERHGVLMLGTSPTRWAQRRRVRETALSICRSVLIPLLGVFY